MCDIRAWWAKTGRAALCSVLVGLSTAMIIVPGPSARAQVGLVPDSLGTFAQVLQQLGSMQTGRSGFGLGSGSFTSPIDSARQRGGAQADSAVAPVVVDGVARPSPALRALQMRVCEGAASEAELRSFRIFGDFSELELDYCRRALQPMQQFGYETFGRRTTPRTTGPVQGAVQDDYRLGIGDELVVTFFAQETRVAATRIDSEGSVVLPNLRSIPAAGRSLGEFRADLESVVARTLPRTEVSVSIGAIRNVRVTVLGEVHSPGTLQMTALSTLADALQLAGGIKKTGSLRQIRLERGNDLTWIDLYDQLFLGGAAVNMSLAEGDRIVVPTIGPTIGVAGQVNRAGVFELAEGRRRIMLSDAVQLAGGALRPRSNRFQHITFDAAGRQQIVDRADGQSPIGAGDLVIVQFADDAQIGGVELAGHVRLVGRRALSSNSSIRALVGDFQALKPGAYLPFAVLETSASGNAPRYVAIDLGKVLGGQEDIKLSDGDRLIVLSNDDVRFLTSGDVQTVLRGRFIETELPKTETEAQRTLQRQRETQQQPAPRPPFLQPSGADLQRSLHEELLRSQLSSQLPPGQTQPQTPATPPSTMLLPTDQAHRCSGLRVLRSVIINSRTERYNAAINAFFNDPENPRRVFERECPEIFDRHESLLPFVLEHVAGLSGEVRFPGAYPVAGTQNLSELVAAAGGLTREVSLTMVEVSTYAVDPNRGVAQGKRGMVDVATLGLQSVRVSAGDVVRFNSVSTDRESGPVLLTGEVARPGLYEIRRGERLSELYQRAGGLTAQAYPFGAVFTRDSVRRTQQIAVRRAARELTSAALFAGASKTPAAFGGGSVQALRELSQELESVEVVGRVVIEADPTVLQVRPDLDTVLEPGDRLFVPKRPAFVMVVGDVLNPSAQQFIGGRKADQYIRQAGGLQDSADETRIFVVHPNGEARSMQLSFWNYAPVSIPPGSTIVVPRQPAALDVLQVIKDVTGVIGQVAVTAASLAVINR